MAEQARCPYTGAEFEIVYCPGVGYTTKNGFDPAEWQDETALLRSLRQREGRQTLRRSQPLVCAYSGKPVTIVRSGTLVRAEGAVSPRQVWSDKWALVFDLSVRNGVEPGFPRTHKVVVGEERRKESDPRLGIAEGIAQAKQAAEEILEGS